MSFIFTDDIRVAPRSAHDTIPPGPVPSTKSARMSPRPTHSLRTKPDRARED
jgi:hypothetical protein